MHCITLLTGGARSRVMRNLACSSTIPMPTFMKFLCWMPSRALFLWPTTIISRSITICCAPVPCLKTLNIYKEWWRKPERSIPITRVLKARIFFVTKPHPIPNGYLSSVVTLPQYFGLTIQTGSEITAYLIYLIHPEMEIRIAFFRSYLYKILFIYATKLTVPQDDESVFSRISYLEPIQIRIFKIIYDRVII